MVPWAARLNLTKKTIFLGKRTKIAIGATATTVAAWISLPQAPNTFGLVFVMLLAAAAGLILWVLAEDLAGIKYLTIPVLPLFYLGSFLLLAKALDLVAVGIFITGVILGVSFYFLLLTQNIYNIAAFRSIGLVRAANVSGTLFIVVSAFLAYGTVWLQQWAFWIITPAIFLISLILFILAIWSQNLEEKIEAKNFVLAALLSLVLAEIGLALTFWPILPLIAALVLAIVFYVVLGLLQFELQQRLTKRVVSEYLVIAGVVLLLILVTTKWGG